MGMSTYIQAFIPDTDPLYQKHKKVFLVCKEAGVSLPQETADYFHTHHSGDDSILEDKLQIDMTLGIHYSEYSSDSAEGVEVDLTTLPKGVTKLRFVNSW
jgi:hypothetical protein